MQELEIWENVSPVEAISISQDIIDLWINLYLINKISQANG